MARVTNNTPQGASMHAVSVPNAPVRVALVVVSALISLLIGTTALPSEAASQGQNAVPATAEYVPGLCLTFSDPAPEPGEPLTIDGCTEPGASAKVSIGGIQVATVASDAVTGTFRVTITIPDLEVGEHRLAVSSLGVELGSLVIVSTGSNDGVIDEPLVEAPIEETPAEIDDAAGTDDAPPPEQLALSDDEGMQAFWSNVRRFLIVIVSVALLFGVISSIENNRAERRSDR